MAVPECSEPTTTASVAVLGVGFIKEPVVSGAPSARLLGFVYQPCVATKEEDTLGIDCRRAATESCLRSQPPKGCSRVIIQYISVIAVYKL